jgi:hypothetical protein
LHPHHCTSKARVMGFEPTIFCSTNRCFEPLSYTPRESGNLEC